MDKKENMLVNDLNAKIQALSSYSSVECTMASLVFAAIVVYISLAEQTTLCLLQYATVSAMLLTCIVSILSSFLYNGAIDDFIHSKNEDAEKKVDLAAGLEACSLCFFLLCLPLILINIIGWKLGSVFIVIELSIFIWWLRL